MTASQPIANSSDTHRFRWRAAGNDRTCNESFDSQLFATSVLPPSMQTATSQTHPHQRVPTNQLPLPLPTELYRSHATAKSP